MAINVYAWPPVGAVGVEWTQHAPVARLRSALTGRDQMQASQRVRRMATLEVSALSADRMGAGYCEMLKQLLAGGIHAVRLRSSPINWHLDEPERASLSGGPLRWSTQDGPLAWLTDAGPLTWYEWREVTAASASTPGGAGHDLLVTGLPPRRLVGRPGDFIRAHLLTDYGVSQVARLLRPATTDAAGHVMLRLDRAITLAGTQINLAGQDEGVFRVDGALPRAVQPVGANWSYLWQFREIFADEVGGFAEVNPWI